MNYTINPCKACTKKFQDSGCNINDLNDCYLETLAAYKNNHNNFVILEDVDDNWEQCMSNKMAKLPYVAGKPRSFCNFQLNRAPVFIEGNHYFPDELNNNNGEPEKALNACKIKCKNSKLPNTCIENCQVDYDALIPYKDNANIKNNPQLRKTINKENVKEKYNTSIQKNISTPSPTPGKNNQDNINNILKEHPITFYISFAVVALIFAIFIFIFLYVISTNN